jgi:DNA ligase-1
MERHVITLLEELESTQGSNAKKDILQVARSNELLQRVFISAFDPYTVYYVNKFKMPPAVQGVVTGDDRVRCFLDLIHDRLATRELTGNEAKRAVESCFGMMTALEQKWCQRILLRNLRCGVQVTTVNKVWPDLIKGFSVALACTLKSEFERGTGIRIMESVSYPVRVEPKLDGLRCIAVKKSGEVTFYTRNGTVLETLPKIRAVLETMAIDDIALDGEAMGEDWNESASVLMSSKTKKDDSNIFYNVFDAMPVADWVAQATLLTYRERCDLVERVLGAANDKHVRQVPHIMATNEEELKDFFARCMDEGYEGVMLKTLATTYEWDRSKNILKLKPCVTYEGTIVGWYEGRRGTKREGLFGGFEVLLPNGVITRVGGGFNDALRTQVQLDTPDAWVGKIVECEAQPDPLTKDGLTNEGKMRFPVYCRLRDEADVDQSVLVAYERWVALNK